MRLVMWLSVPVLILSIALLVTIVMNWSQGVPFCATWLRAGLPFCQ
jgi:hypothetical protein